MVNKVILKDIENTSVIERLKEQFEKTHQDIMLGYDLVFYNDMYIKILLAKHIIIELDTSTIANNIKLLNNKNQCPDNENPCPTNVNDCSLNYFDKEKINITHNYIKTLGYFSKNKDILRDNLREISVYDKNYLIAFDIVYLIKKFELEKTINIIYVHKIKDQMPKIISSMKNNKYNIYNNFNDFENVAATGSCIVNASTLSSEYNINEQVNTLIRIHNILIKLKPNDFTYVVRIFPLHLTTLTFQIVDILKSYFKFAYLVKPKYDPSVNFYLVLTKKIKEYDETHIINIMPRLSIDNMIMSDTYKNFFNELIVRLNDSLHIYFSLLQQKKSDPKNYIMINEQINIYRQYYVDKFKNDNNL